MSSSKDVFVRIDPDLRASVEALLSDGESFDSFVHEAVRACVERRSLHREFLAAALARRASGSDLGRYLDAEEVISRLENILARASAKGS
jgi:predicted transcriptional regulator